MMTEAMENYSTEMDIPGSLPIEIFQHILMYLSPQELHNTWNCCKKWRNLMQSFWKIKCRKDGYYECEDDLKSEVYRNCLKKFSRWEAIYMYNSMLENNWITQNYKEVANVDLMKGFSIQCFSGDILIATAVDGVHSAQIIFINTITGVVEKQFNITLPNGMCKSILAVEKFENLLIAVVIIQEGNIIEVCTTSPSFETLYIMTWNIVTDELFVHPRLVILIKKVLIYKHLIILLTHCCKVLIYNIRKKQFDYDNDFVSSVCYDNNRIAMAYFKNNSERVLIMDLDYSILMILHTSCNSSISKLHMKGNYLVTEYYDTTNAYIWNIDNKKILYKVEKLDSQIFLHHLQDNKLSYFVCSSSNDQENLIMFRLCHLDTGDCLLQLVCSANYLHYAYVRTNRFFVLERNPTHHHLMKLWSIKTGKLIVALKLPLSIPTTFFYGDYCNRNAKGKVAYLENKSTQRNDTIRVLKIMDFEANIRDLL